MSMVDGAVSAKASCEKNKDGMPACLMAESQDIGAIQEVAQAHADSTGHTVKCELLRSIWTYPANHEKEDQA